ncbi:MAG TPA: hypothetical protein V6C58_01295 [Allocoleopsis sp.]
MATYSFDSGYNLSNNPFNNNYNVGTTNSNSLDELTNQFYNNLNNDFASTLPKFSYDPKTGDEDVTAKNDRFRQQNREDLAYNQQLSNEDADYKNNLAYKTDLEKRNRDKADLVFKYHLDSMKALAEREANRPKTQTFSYSSTVDPNSREGQNIAIWQNINARNKGYEQGLMNDAEVTKQKQLIPMQTQATIQTQAPQFQSQQKVADIQAEAQKAVAEATARANMYGANLNAMSSMFGSQMGAVGNMFGGMNTGGNARYW